MDFQKFLALEPQASLKISIFLIKKNQKFFENFQLLFVVCLMGSLQFDDDSSLDRPIRTLQSCTHFPFKPTHFYNFKWSDKLFIREKISENFQTWMSPKV